MFINLFVGFGLIIVEVKIVEGVCRVVMVGEDKRYCINRLVERKLKDKKDD